MSKSSISFDNRTTQQALPNLFERNFAAETGVMSLTNCHRISSLTEQNQLGTTTWDRSAAASQVLPADKEIDRQLQPQPSMYQMAWTADGTNPIASSMGSLPRPQQPFWPFQLPSLPGIAASASPALPAACPAPVALPLSPASALLPAGWDVLLSQGKLCGSRKDTFLLTSGPRRRFLAGMQQSFTCLFTQKPARTQNL